MVVVRRNGVIKCVDNSVRLVLHHVALMAAFCAVNGRTGRYVY